MNKGLFQIGTVRTKSQAMALLFYKKVK